MFSFKANKPSAFYWLKHPQHYLFFKIFTWFWVTIIGTVTALIFFSNIGALNLVSNEPLQGPIEKTSCLLREPSELNSTQLTEAVFHQI